MRHAILVLIVLAIPVLAHSATLKVPSQYPTIQDAIDAAVNGDIILVAPGTYVENIDFKGKAITVKNDQGPDVTVINGNLSGRVVTFNSGEGPDSILDGFTITNGTSTKGGGILCEKSSPTLMNNIVIENPAGGIYCADSTALIVNNTISNNTSGGSGVGIKCNYGSPTIMNNVIYGNKHPGTYGNGGGIYCYECTVTISNNIITANENYCGGGIYCYGGNAIIINNIVTGNSVGYDGGGIYCYECTASIRNNIIYGNMAAQGGGGIQCMVGSKPIIINNTIFGNSAVYGGGIRYATPGLSQVVKNSILWNNTGGEIYVLSGNPKVTYCDVEGGYFGTGNIDLDPLFVDSANSDFHLSHPSPCKDSGDNSAVLDLYDFEGDPRIAYGTVDMGADEFYTHLYWTGDATPGGNVEVKLVGLPGTNPVFLWVGSGVLGAPIPTMYGDWHLDFPILLSLGLGPIFTPEGVSVLPYTFDPGFPAMDIPMQALIGAELTNLSVMEVE